MKRSAESDSDSSIDLEIPCRATESASHHEYGIGASLMAKMGYNAGQGLGAQHQGITAPLEQVQRIKKVGLGAEGAERKPRKAVFQEHQPPTPDSNRVRLDQCKQVLTSLDTLKSTQFILAYSQLPIWTELKLWEAVVAKLPQEYGWLSLDQFAERFDDLYLAWTVLPSGNWEAFMNTFWTPKLTGATTEALLDQLEILKGILPLSGLEALAESLLENIHRILAHPPFLERTLRSLPRFLVHAKELFSDTEFSEKELAVMGNAKLVLEGLLQQAGGNLQLICKILEERAAEVNDDESRELVSRYLIPQWMSDLADLAVSGELTKSWWLQYRQYVSDNRVVLQALNMINFILDRGQIPDDVEVCKVDASLADALDYYCYMHEYKCVFDSDRTGIIGTVPFELFDDILYIKGKPSSFTDIKNYL